MAGIRKPLNDSGVRRNSERSAGGPGPPDRRGGDVRQAGARQYLLAAPVPPFAIDGRPAARIRGGGEMTPAARGAPSESTAIGFFCGGPARAAPIGRQTMRDQIRIPESGRPLIPKGARRRCLARHNEAPACGPSVTVHRAIERAQIRTAPRPGREGPNAVPSGEIGDDRP